METKSSDFQKKTEEKGNAIYIIGAIIGGLILFGLGLVIGAFAFKSNNSDNSSNGDGYSNSNPTDCNNTNVTANTATNSTNIDYNLDFGTITPSWHDGHMGVGRRVETIDVLDDNIGMVYRVTNRIPLPINEIWSIFDNYLDFQTKFGDRTNVIHNSGPNNDIGEIISYKKDNNMMYEELSIKNDTNYFWRVIMPNSTSNIYNQYIYTVRLYEDNYYDNIGTLLVTDMEWLFLTNTSQELRKEIMLKNKINSHDYHKMIYDIALNKVGMHTPFNITVNVSRDWFFNLVIDWTNDDWVILAKENSLIMYQPDIRIFETQFGTRILERVSVMDVNIFQFEYQVLNDKDGMPLRDTINFKEITADSVNVFGSLSVYPQPGQNTTTLAATYQFVVAQAANGWKQVLVPLYEASKNTTT